MDPLSILQGALSLLGRPGNAVRGAIIDPDHLEGFGRGITGQQQYDGTELPGINSLPDEGPSLGPLHITPRTVGGFAGSSLLDPLTYAGGSLGRIGELLGGLGRGADATGGLLSHAQLPAGLADELAGRSLGGVTSHHFQLPQLGAYQSYSKPEIDAINDETHAAVTAGQEMHQADAPETLSHEQFVRRDIGNYTGQRPEYLSDSMSVPPMGIDYPGRSNPFGFGSSARMSTDPEHLVENAQERMGFDPADNTGTELSASDPLPAHSGSLQAQEAPDASQPIPVGDPLTAQARDKVARSQNQMAQLQERKRAMEGYLIQTGNAEVDPDTKELVIHMKGSQEPVSYERGGEPDEIDPETVRSAITDTERQMAELSQADGYRTPRQFQDWQAKRDVRNDPSLIDAQRYNDAANNAGNSAWMNANSYRQRLQGDDLNSTIQNVYTAMSGWKNRDIVDAERLTPRAVREQSALINEQSKPYHKWWNSGASGIEDPNDPELLSNQYSSRALEEGDYVTEPNTRTDSSGTMAAGKYPLQVQRGGQISAAAGDDRITFPDLLAREQGNDGMYRYINDQGRGAPGSIPARQLDKLQQEDLLLRRDDIARPSAPDTLFPIRRTQSWADSVDTRAADMGKDIVGEAQETLADNGGRGRLTPEIADLASVLGDRDSPEANPRDIIAQLAELKALDPNALIQILSGISKPQAMLTPSERAALPTRSVGDLTHQLGLPGQLGAAGIPGDISGLEQVMQQGHMVPGPEAIVARPGNFEEWLYKRLRPRGMPEKPAF